MYAFDRLSLPESQGGLRPLLTELQAFGIPSRQPRPPRGLDEELESTLVVAPRREQIQLCVAAHLFRRWTLAQEWGFLSQADYVRERLGESLSTFCDWAYAGRLFVGSRACRSAFRSGSISLSAAALLGQRCTPLEAESWLSRAAEVSVARLRELLRGGLSPASDSTPPPEPPIRGDADAPTLTLSMLLPQSAVSYCEETLELARAVSGVELTEPEAVAAVLAEASTEISPPDLDAALLAPRVPADFLPATRSRRRQRTSASAHPAGAGPRPRRPRCCARRLDARLRGAQRELRRLETRGEDLLLLARETDWHCYYQEKNFYRFVLRRFGISKSTAIERIESARLRRRLHPLAVARAEGRLGAVQSFLLRRLERLGVPRSALPAWIDHARRTTVRWLRRCVAWAVRMARSRQRQWSLEGCPPPSFAEVRTSELSLCDLAAHPDPPRTLPASPEPQERFRWSLHGADHALLLDLVFGLTQEVRARAGRTPPPAWTLLHIFHLARHAWRDAARSMPRHPHHEVLDRDHYRCQVPGCSRRSVEVHHIVFRSQGGTDDPQNLICLCAAHHRWGVHDGRLRVSGRVTDSRDELHFDLGVGSSGRALLSYVGECLA